MTHDKPHESKPRPEPAPSPSVYGGQWGPGAEQNPEDEGRPDRPGKIETPNDEAPGAGEHGN